MKERQLLERMALSYGMDLSIALTALDDHTVKLLLKGVPGICDWRIFDDVRHPRKLLLYVAMMHDQLYDPRFLAKPYSLNQLQALYRACLAGVSAEALLAIKESDESGWLQALKQLASDNEGRMYS